MYVDQTALLHYTAYAGSTLIILPCPGSFQKWIGINIHPNKDKVRG